jgi:hypothetical protein
MSRGHNLSYSLGKPICRTSSGASETNTIAAITIAGDTWGNELNMAYRLDTPEARAAATIPGISSVSQPQPNQAARIPHRKPGRSLFQLLRSDYFAASGR